MDDEPEDFTMHNATEITAEVARMFLDYNRETGEFRWKHRGREWFERRLYWLAWNTKFAGKVAGSGRDGYRTICIFHRPYRAHRLAWLIETGCWPLSAIDHINGVRDDNRIVNLRAVTNAENARNQGRRSTNTSGHTGVSWDKRRSRWDARIMLDGRQRFLGSYNNPEEAHAAYARAATGFSERHIFGQSLLRHAEEHLAKAKDEADRAGWQEVVDHLNSEAACYA